MAAFGAVAPARARAPPTVKQFEQFDDDNYRNLPQVLRTNSHGSSRLSDLSTYRQGRSPSSHLPAFRLQADRRSYTLPSLLQQSATPDSDPHEDATIKGLSSTPAPGRPPQPRHRQYNNDTVSPGQSTQITEPSPKTPARSRSSTFQTATTSIPVTPSPTVKRSIPLDSRVTATTPSREAQPEEFLSPVESTVPKPTGWSRQGAPGIDASVSGIPLAPSIQRQNSADSNRSRPPSDDVTKEWTYRQGELSLPPKPSTPKSIQRPDDRRQAGDGRPPALSKSSASASASAAATAAIPPIRAFRSSGSRKSLVLDANGTPPTMYDLSDDMSDSTQRDRALWTLEGGRNDGARWTPPDSAKDRPDTDDSGDVFLKIAREDQRRAACDNVGPAEPLSAVSRAVRSMHRRPLSTAITPSYSPTSPPQFARRLSEQHDIAKGRSFGDEQPPERLTRTATHNRRISRSGGALKPSPLTPRSMAFQDAGADGGSAYSRRRQSITDSRLTSLKTSLPPSYSSRAYNSSPLVPKSMETQRFEQNQSEQHPPEGTESSASTAAPSTVWDELDEMKGRIRRLELSGKLPPTSGAAMSRASDERPPTATTNATTLSGSPKRGSGSGAQADAASTISSAQRKEAHPLLQSALKKSKPLLGSEIYGPLETAANDAVSLSSMVGLAGQAGPIASGASTIGSNGNVTDRQLRRKADSICRSLTELCLALSENVAQIKRPQSPRQEPVSAPETEPGSPTITKFSGFSGQRRPSTIMSERSPLADSPRAMSRLEEKRSNMLNTALPSPSTRYNPRTPIEGAARKTSLLVARTRRAATEEPEDMGRKSSMLRTRRAGTEEPEEPAPGRKTSMLLRTRRTAPVNEESESQLRAPSRAVPNATVPKRAETREYASQMPVPSTEGSSLASSALPRRRMVPPALNTRLAQPSSSSSLSARRYADRPTPDRESVSAIPGKTEDKGRRQYSLSNIQVPRTASTNKRSSLITPSSATPYTNGYR